MISFETFALQAQRRTEALRRQITDPQLMSKNKVWDEMRPSQKKDMHKKNGIPPFVFLGSSGFPPKDPIFVKNLGHEKKDLQRKGPPARLLQGQGQRHHLLLPARLHLFHHFIHLPG